MPALSSLARINLSGFRANGVDGYSPIEDQVETVYRAAKHYAESHGFTRTANGYVGDLVMSQLTGILFSNNPDRDPRRHNDLIYRALRASGAARCINHAQDHTPRWHIAFDQPASLRDVAKALASGSAGIRPAPNPLKPTDTERRLTTHEAGEDRQPSEVKVRTVTVTSTEETETVWPSPAVQEAFQERWDAMADQHRRIVNQVHEQIATSPQPVTATDVKELLERDGTSLNTTTVHNAIRELLEMGRIVGRKETRNEALIRGGGRMPKATRPLLFAASPGPVPERTALPPGVSPRVPLEDQLLTELRRSYPKTVTSRPRSPGALARLTRYDVPTVKAALERLAEKGTVYRGDDGGYYLTERRRKHAETATAETLTGVVTVSAGVEVADSHEPDLTPTCPDVKQNPDTIPAEARALVNQIGTLVGALASLPAYESHDLNKRVRDLEAENAALRQQLDNLKARIGGLLG